MDAAALRCEKQRNVGLFICFCTERNSTWTPKKNFNHLSSSCISFSHHTPDLSEDDLHLVTLLHIHQIAGNVAGPEEGGRDSGEGKPLMTKTPPFQNFLLHFAGFQKKNCFHAIVKLSFLVVLWLNYFWCWPHRLRCSLKNDYKWFMFNDFPWFCGSNGYVTHSIHQTNATGW